MPCVEVGGMANIQGMLLQSETESIETLSRDKASLHKQICGSSHIESASNVVKESSDPGGLGKMADECKVDCGHGDL